MDRLSDFLRDVFYQKQGKLEDADFENGTIGDILQHIKDRKEKIALQAGMDNDTFEIIEMLHTEKEITDSDYEMFKRNEAVVATLFTAGVDMGVALCADITYDMSRIYEIIQKKDEHDEKKS